MAFASGQAYNSSLTSYFSQQEEQTRPTCIVQPTSAQDVATAIKVLSRSGPSERPCLFAIRGGGHMTFAGSANINNGVTIDLRKLNQISLSQNSTVSVGGGMVWQQVYEYLDARNLTAAGGRVGEVGVGGLTTGGE